MLRKSCRSDTEMSKIENVSKGKNEFEQLCAKSLKRALGIRVNSNKVHVSNS